MEGHSNAAEESYGEDKEEVVEEFNPQKVKSEDAEVREVEIEETNGGDDSSSSSSSGDEDTEKVDKRHQVEKISGDCDFNEDESGKTEEKISQYVEAEAENGVVTDAAALEGIEGPTLPNNSEETNFSPTDDKGAVSDMVSEVTEENTTDEIEQRNFPPSEASNVKEEMIEEEAKLPYPEENAADLASKEIAAQPVNPPPSTGNPHIMSVTKRTLQPTSWRSCCGLFEVLRRSNN